MANLVDYHTQQLEDARRGVEASLHELHHRLAQALRVVPAPERPTAWEKLSVAAVAAAFQAKVAGAVGDSGPISIAALAGLAGQEQEEVVATASAQSGDLSGITSRSRSPQDTSLSWGRDEDGEDGVVLPTQRIRFNVMCIRRPDGGGSDGNGNCGGGAGGTGEGDDQAATGGVHLSDVLENVETGGLEADAEDGNGDTSKASASASHDAEDGFSSEYYIDDDEEEDEEDDEVDENGDDDDDDSSGTYRADGADDDGDQFYLPPVNSHASHDDDAPQLPSGTAGDGDWLPAALRTAAAGKPLGPPAPPPPSAGGARTAEAKSAPGAASGGGRPRHQEDDDSDDQSFDISDFESSTGDKGTREPGDELE